MQICIQRLSRLATSEVDEGGHMSKAVKFSVEPTWPENYEHAEVCVDCKQGFEIEGVGTKEVQRIPMSFRQRKKVGYTMSECPPNMKNKTDFHRSEEYLLKE